MLPNSETTTNVDQKQKLQHICLMLLFFNSNKKSLSLIAQMSVCFPHIPDRRQKYSILWDKLFYSPLTSVLALCYQPSCQLIFPNRYLLWIYGRQVFALTLATDESRSASSYLGLIAVNAESLLICRLYTRWFKYDRDWFVCKQAAVRSSCATLREWSHKLHPPFCSG